MSLVSLSPPLLSSHVTLASSLLSAAVAAAAEAAEAAASI